MNRQINDKKTINYLEEILARKLLIANPTKLDIPGFGEVTATSMVDYNVSKMGPYFRFRSKDGPGEFFRENGKYFVKYYIGGTI